jgi:pilus assembly protein CpaC
MSNGLVDAVRSRRRNRRAGTQRLRRAATFGILLTFASMLAASGAELDLDRSQIIRDENAPVRHVTIPVYKARTYRSPVPFATAVVGSPDVADVLPMSDQAIYVQAKKVGTTNISLFSQNKRLIAVLDVDVTIDVEELARRIHAEPGTAGIRVSSNSGQITNSGQIVLSGEAQDAVAANRAVQLARGQLPKDAPENAIVNAMKVAPTQQVMLRVRFLEASRTAERDLGFNWFLGTSGGTRGINTGNTGANIGPLTQAGPTPSSAGVPLFQTFGTFAGTSTSFPFGVALANLAHNGTTLDVLITALEEKGLVRRLAEPDLVALSGDTASFLAGGEIPVPVAQQSSTPGGTPPITVEYKQFGVQLTFMPTVLDNGIINLRLAPSVSQLDFTNAVQVSGFLIPALTTREARTTIELRDGQSFAIAGLLQTDGTRNISQIPWLGSVPVLGTLFRSSAYQKNETDLVVIVTPHLVAPAAPGQRLATPLDERLPSNDVDFFLLGQMEMRKKYRDYVASGGDLHGPYGHMIRPDEDPPTGSLK